MKCRRGCVSLLALSVLLSAFAPAPAAAQGDDARYALANGCYALHSQALGRLVAKDGSGGYRASAGQPAEAFRMQATDLGKYLLFGPQSDFLAAGSGDRVETARRASEAADWRVDVVGSDRFRLFNQARERVLAVAREDGRLVLAGDGAGDAAVFSFDRADGCATFPESETGATGRPARGPAPYSEVRGFLDAHLHLMAFEFLGGSIRCGRPWHPYGIQHALVDCPDHEPGGAGAALENSISYGNPARTHDTTGWPTFKDWPDHRSLTHEQIYYRWLERAWLGGLRVFVNLLVDNGVLCELYPLKRNPCDEMATARLELQRTLEFQDYVDAQNGGPGKGWFRIVRDPFEARRVISEGKLAVVLGMETSRLFDCTVQNDVPECDRAQIDRYLDEFHAAGVRYMLLVNKFDNALTGVAGDEGQTGTVVNSGNRYETGRFWQFDTCSGPAADKEQTTTPGHNEDTLVSALQLFLPPGTAPLYPAPPHCNARGLTDLGDYLLRRMVEKRIVFDPDHMSVLGRNQALAVMEALDYSGVVSSHSWSTQDAFPRIYKLGGVIAPSAGSSTGFVKEWREVRPLYSGQQYFGFGYGADTNGFAAQGGPRQGNEDNPVRYPFRSIDGAVTLHRQRTGERVWDINTDGVDHYGLYPDWIEDLRMIAGDQIVDDMSRGAEAFLQMWERTYGIPAAHCRSARARYTRNGLGRVRLRYGHARLLRWAGQPAERGPRVWRWCVHRNPPQPVTQVTAVLTPRARVGLVTGGAIGHRAQRIGPGHPASRVRRVARRFGRGVFVRRAGRGVRFFYLVRGGRVRQAGVASPRVTKTPRRLRSYLRLAGLL